jgi:cation:H+ antiporter
MLGLGLIWLSLLACLAVIGVTGVRLACYGDIIAEKSGMSRGWGGLLPIVYRLNTLFLSLHDP